MLYCSTGKYAVIGGSASTSYSFASATTPTTVRHGPVRSLAQSLAERILVRPEARGELVVDDDDFRRLLVVLLGEDSGP